MCNEQGKSHDMMEGDQRVLVVCGGCFNIFRSCNECHGVLGWDVEVVCFGKEVWVKRDGMKGEVEAGDANYDVVGHCD